MIPAVLKQNKTRELRKDSDIMGKKNIKNKIIYLSAFMGNLNHE
jgi:hypothetical protein